jgi:hypothetical protein
VSIVSYARKLIEDQKDIAEDEKLELYSIFDKNEYRKIIMRRAI